MKDATHTTTNIRLLRLRERILRTRIPFRATLTYLSNETRVMEKIDAAKNVSVAGARYRQTASPKNHLNGSCSFKMAIGKLNNSTQRSAIARLKRYWLVDPSTWGFRMIVKQTKALPMIPKMPRVIWNPILKMVSPNGSSR